MDSNSSAYPEPHIVGEKVHPCGTSLKYISFKKFSFGQKTPYVLRDIVPRCVILQSRGGRFLNGCHSLTLGRKYKSKN